MVPVLLTERLRLDAPRADDWEPLAAMWQQEEVYRYIGDGRPRSRGEVWKALTGSAGQWLMFGFGGWVLRERLGGTVLGTIGLMEARRDLVPPLTAPEASWMLGRDAQGRGVAREGLDAMLDWTDAAGIARTQCIIDPANARSIALAELVGYEAIGKARFAGEAGGPPVRMFERKAVAGC